MFVVSLTVDIGRISKMHNHGNSVDGIAVIVFILAMYGYMMANTFGGF